MAKDEADGFEAGAGAGRKARGQYAGRHRKDGDGTGFKKVTKAGDGFPAGSRTTRPHSEKGWATRGEDGNNR